METPDRDFNIQTFQAWLGSLVFRYDAKVLTVNTIPELRACYVDDGKKMEFIKELQAGGYEQGEGSQNTPPQKSGTYTIVKGVDDDWLFHVRMKE